MIEGVSRGQYSLVWGLNFLTYNYIPVLCRPIDTRTWDKDGYWLPSIDHGSLRFHGVSDIYCVTSKVLYFAPANGIIY